MSIDEEKLSSLLNRWDERRKSLNEKVTVEEIGPWIAAKQWKQALKELREILPAPRTNRHW